MTTSDSWFGSAHTSGNAELRLFCFPYAGGNALVYRDWANLLPGIVRVVAVELPGRGARSKEIPFSSLPPLIDVLAEAIVPHLDGPFGFFGHSMGALVAFELARRIRRQYEREPELMIVSARRAPRVPDTDPPTYALPKEEFIAELERIHGTPKEVLEHAELMELMIPLLRADFEVTQTYEYIPGDLLRCPIIAYGGLQDEVTREMLLPWQDETTAAFALHMLPGDHFFLKSSQAVLLDSLKRELNKSILHARAKPGRSTNSR